MNSAFSQKIIQNWGERGREWLKMLPCLIQALEQQWNLEKITPFKNLSYNFVAQATQKPHCREVILKIGVDPAEIETEIRSLKFYKGKGCVRLLSCDPQRGAFLMKSVRPGFSLKSSFPQKDEFAVSVASRIMKSLHAHSQKPDGFDTLEEWLNPLLEGKAPGIPLPILSKAGKMAEKLLKSQTESVLLHGDLHHENILYQESRDWIAIDPKSVIGERAYEVGAFMRNPWPEILTYPALPFLLSHRLFCFARFLDIDIARLKAWSYVQSVLSAHWFNGNKEAALALGYARMLEKL